MIITGLNSISADSYFIRDTTRNDCFIHPFKEDAKEIVYTLKSGLVGACIFDKKNATNLISFIDAPNLEMVKVTELLPNDGTFN